MDNTIQKFDKISESNLDLLSNEIENAFYDIPLGNSQFQCKMFIIAANITPARAYRSIGLQMKTILGSLESMKYDEKLKQIQIEKLQYEINDSKTDQFERRKKEIELEQLSKVTKNLQKSANDLLHELNFYYSYFSKMPRFTREEFESNERLYFEQSLQRQCLGLTGAKEALLNMMDDAKTIDNFEKMYEALPQEQKHLFNDLIVHQSMAGLLQLKNNVE